MGDTASKRTSAIDQPLADIPPGSPERIVGFFSEDSLKGNSQSDRANEPAKASNVISISALANVTAAKPHLDDALPALPASKKDVFATAGEDSEAAPSEADGIETHTRFSWPSRTQAAIAVLSLIAVAEFFLLVSRAERPQPPSSAAPAGIVAVESTPPGATILINGEDRGVTPASLSLRPGEYAMSLLTGDAVRNVRLVVRGGNSSERFYFGGVDGESLGQSASKPAAETTTPSATHGTTALPSTGAVGGWLNVSAPIDLQLFENGVLVGSSQTDRIMLPVGRHVIEAVNTAIGYKTSSTVQVSAGTVTRLKPEMPSGTLNINAIPWADVAVDGKALGTTPLGNVSLPIGPHDVTFTHPQLGERHENVVVTLNGINRVSVNLSQR